MRFTWPGILIGAGVRMLLLAGSPEGEAQERTAVEAGGYVKYMPWLADGVSGSARVNHLVHARLNTAWYPGEEWKGVLEGRVRISTETQPAGRGDIDRAAVIWSHPGVQVTVGRQRIAWGTNLVWNPIDLFNPLSILDFDYEERPAVDGLRVQWYTGELSQIEGGMKYGRRREEIILAGMWSFHAGETDYRILAGSRGGRGFIGAAWAGDISGGGFRGEILAYDPREEGRRWGCTAAISGDYTFPNTFYIHTELLLNSEGSRGRTPQMSGGWMYGETLSPARYSVYQEVSMDLSPLLRGSVFAIMNPDDGSRVVVPSLSWNVAENWDLLGLVIIAGGSAGTEYGEYGRTCFVRLRYAF